MRLQAPRSDAGDFGAAAGDDDLVLGRAVPRDGGPAPRNEHGRRPAHGRRRRQGGRAARLPRREPLRRRHRRLRRLADRDRRNRPPGGDVRRQRDAPPRARTVRERAREPAAVHECLRRGQSAFGGRRRQRRPWARVRAWCALTLGVCARFAGVDVASLAPPLPRVPAARRRRRRLPRAPGPRPPGGRSHEFVATAAWRHAADRDLVHAVIAVEAGLPPERTIARRSPGLDAVDAGLAARPRRLRRPPQRRRRRRCHRLDFADDDHIASCNPRARRPAMQRDSFA